MDSSNIFFIFFIILSRDTTNTVFVSTMQYTA